MDKNKTEIIAQIAALLSQLVESDSVNQNETVSVSNAAPLRC